MGEGASLLRIDGFEAPAKANAICGWCERGASFERATGPVESSVENAGYGARRYALSAAYVCMAPECGRLSILFFEAFSTRMADSPARLVAQIPRGVPTVMDGLPEKIERDRVEAWSCLYGGDIRAAILMARSAVQRSVRHLAAKRGDLKSEIADLLAKQKITQDLHDFADEVRLAGNDVAHPEDLEEVTEEEAEESLTFMDEFLRVAIALPERTKARRAQRGSTS